MGGSWEICETVLTTSMRVENGDRSFITFQNPFGGDEYLSASCFNVSMV
jgi:hypothetical protein